MDESDPLYEYTRAFMIQLMAVLWRNGQKELHVGGAMRLLGVPDAAAAEHDNERLEIDENFAILLAEVNRLHLQNTQVPAGVTIH